MSTSVLGVFALRLLKTKLNYRTPFVYPYGRKYTYVSSKESNEFIISQKRNTLTSDLPFITY